ncbi:hypothetical protein PC116_g26373 [Phytophthora cactorum]|nr:hypothetical protein PC114_g24634 [Phytophthora cactorum]KAG3142923.1 hypothetical protein PC128_g24693 [Phytophthora cactorum]KAG4038641.1 hypothetical protein PC123_g25799 [Phytophthora cactorum]KAG4225190.1 hypothetical protein PC116_g26373 [Phytophthora cactorum]
MLYCKAHEWLQDVSAWTLAAAAPPELGTLQDHKKAEDRSVLPSTSQGIVAVLTAQQLGARFSSVDSRSGLKVPVRR